MKATAPRLWLDDLLSGAAPDSSSLERFLAECGREGDLHDYKSGRELDDPAKGARTLRQYVSGFGNGEGGFILFGVTNDRKVDGCHRPGGQALDEWATRCLIEQAPYFAPQPRMFTIPYSGALLASSRGPQEVLLVAVSRAPSLVPCIERGRLVYYLRIGDSTKAAPEYLLADLVLGRRNRPRLLLPEGSATVSQKHGSNLGSEHTSVIDLRVRVIVENESVVFADRVRLGAVAWVLGHGLRPTVPLLSAVDVEPPPTEIGSDPGWTPRWTLAHLVPESQDPALKSFGPFDRASQAFHITLPAWPGRKPLLRAGIYVLARNSPPWWYQLDARYDENVARARGLEDRHLRAPDITLESRPVSRPVVSWSPPGAAGN